MEKYCLCCGKKLTSDASLWHLDCIKNFFGTSTFPDVSLLEEEIEELAVEELIKGNAITGVQKKLSFGLSKNKGTRRLTLTNLDPKYIIKTEDETIPYITEMEHLIMLLAERIGLHTVKHGLIKTQNNGYLYISKRIDRKNDQKLAMEDFCQLSNKLTEYKYQGSYERCVKEVIDKFSSRKVIDKISFFNCIYFSYLVGNTDMHLKNFSLFDNGLGYHLSPFYDLVSSLILVGQEEMALALNGKRKHLTKNDFISFGVSSGLTKELTIKLMDNINKKLKEVYESEIDRSLISEKFKEELKDLIKKRIASLI